MSDPRATADERDLLRRATEAHTAAVRDVEVFLRGLPAVPGPAHVTEYATLLSREERARVERQSAADAVGLTVGSVEAE